MGRRLGSRYEELIDDWLDLTVLQARKRGTALKNRLVGDADTYNGLLDRESLRAEDGVKYFRDTLRRHFIKGAQSEMMTRRKGQVDWTIFIALETLKGFLDGHVTVVRRGRRTKTKPVSR